MNRVSFIVYCTSLFIRIGLISFVLVTFHMYSSLLQCIACLNSYASISFSLLLGLFSNIILVSFRLYGYLLTIICLFYSIYRSLFMCYRFLIKCIHLFFRALHVFFMLLTATRGYITRDNRPTCAHKHTHAHTHAHTHVHTHTPMHTHRHTHTHTHACTHTYIHTHTHTRMHTRTHMHARTRTHARTHACTRVRTHAHAHAHNVPNVSKLFDMRESYHTFECVMSHI